MPLKPQTIVLPFTRGVDQGGADPKNTTGLALAENLTVTRKGVIEKRNGRNAIGATQADGFLGQHKGHPVLFGEYVKVLDGADPTAGDWEAGNPLAPYCGFVDIESKVVRAVGDIRTPSTDTRLYRPEVLRIGNTRLTSFIRGTYAWLETTDVHSQALIEQAVNSTVGRANSRIVAPSAGTHAYWFTVNGSNQLIMTPVTAAGDVLTADAINMASVHSWPDVDDTAPFDVCVVDTNQAIIVYKEDGADELVMGEIRWTAEAINREAAVQVTYTDLVYVACAKWTTGEAVVAFQQDSATTTVKAGVWDPNVGVTPTVSVDTLSSWVTTDVLAQMAVGVTEDDTTAWVYWTEHESSVVPKESLLRRARYYQASAGVGSAGAEGEQTIGGNCKLWCKPFLDSSDRLFVGIFMSHHLSPSVNVPQRLYVLLENSTTATSALSLPVGKWLVDVALAVDDGLGTTDEQGAVCSPQEIATDQWIVAGIEIGSQHYVAIAKSKFNIHEIKIDTDVASVSDLEVADDLILPGSAPAFFDGRNVIEQQFLTYPPAPEVTGVGVGSGWGAGAGDFVWASLYEITDAQGNVWQSPLSIVSETITIGTQDSVSVVVRNLLVSRLRNLSGAIDGVQIVIFRSDKAGSKALRRLTTIANSWDAAKAAAFSDTGFDIATHEQEYTYYTTQAANHQPPSYTIATEWQSRLFVVDDRFRDRLIRYSLEFVSGQGLGFPTNFSIPVPPKYGDMTGLVGMDDKIVAFKRGCILATSGRGLDEKNYGPGFGEPFFVSEGLGCIDKRSIVTTPIGVMFQSDEGVFALDSGLSLAPVGRVVKYHTDLYSVTRAVLDSRNGRVIFFTNGTNTALVYHYLFDFWTTWTHHDATDAVVVDGVVYFKGSGTGWVYHHDADIWKDYPDSWIAMKLRTAVLPLTKLFDAKRVWEIMLAGYVRSDCNLTIRIAYDGDPEWADELTFDAGTLENFDWTAYFASEFSSDGTYDDQSMLLRWRGSRTKVESSIQFEVVDSGPT